MLENTRPVYASGECEIDLARRELRVLGSPVAVGGRAFEIIEVLAQSAGELVTKDELMNRVWPGAIVMDATLHVHAAAVRKALGPYRSLLKTESRRGYRLLGDWTVQCRDTRKRPVHSYPIRIPGASPATNFPVAGSCLIGRSFAVDKLLDLVSAYRVVTLTGPGGIGKTTLALTVAREILGEFSDGGWLVELASLADPHLVPSAVAGVLGLRLGSDVISAETVARAIGTKKLLLVLDNCEHVISAVATLAEMFMRLCPYATMLATSREFFRIEGEHVYRVPALDVPASELMQPEQILSHSAAELFITRANELGSDIASRGENLSMIAAICRQLDGIPLAIEFAAAQAAMLGVEQVAAALRDRLALLKNVRRAALPRHRTLRATLDWSYELLPDRERRLLRRLSVFSGSFPLAAVSAVANRGEASEAEIAEGVANLVAKSLLTSDVTSACGYYRLLETTRVYALAKLTENGELPEFSRRHAEYYKEVFERIANKREKRTTPLAHIDNARAALEWCFGAKGNPAIGVKLAAAIAPIFLAMSLLRECARWSQLAIDALDDTDRAGAEEMHLQASLGVSLMNMYGQSDAARLALDRSLMVAQARGDNSNQVELLSTLTIFHTRGGNFKVALEYAELGRAVAGATANVAAQALAHSALGRTLYFTGDHSGARAALEASSCYWSGLQGAGQVHLGLDHRILVDVGLARSLWLQGYPAQAAERMREAIRNAEGTKRPTSLDFALFWAPGLFLWLGDLGNAEEFADRLISHGTTHFLDPYLAVGCGYKGAVAIRTGDARGGVANIRSSLQQLDAIQYRMLDTDFKLVLVEGLTATGQLDECMTLINETISLIERNGDLLQMPEALRMKGRVLLNMPHHRSDEAEKAFIQSLDWARRQAARSWELRTAVDLAGVWKAQGQYERARALLEPIYTTFAEGLGTGDLMAARQLLASLEW